jgi:hypothetical protein
VKERGGEGRKREYQVHKGKGDGGRRGREEKRGEVGLNTQIHT